MMSIHAKGKKGHKKLENRFRQLYDNRMQTFSTRCVYRLWYYASYKNQEVVYACVYLAP